MEHTCEVPLVNSEELINEPCKACAQKFLDRYHDREYQTFNSSHAMALAKWIMTRTHTTAAAAEVWSEGYYAGAEDWSDG